MPQCTQCGFILNEADASTHVCDPADIPEQGKMMKPTTTKVDKE